MVHKSVHAPNRGNQVTKLPPDKLAAQVKYWQDGAADDLTTAREIITATTRYAAGLFFLHLSIEKILKALCVKRTGQYAPVTHNLLGLAAKCGLSLGQDQERTLAEINEFNLETRYPDDRDAFLRRVTRELAQQSLSTAEGFYRWILGQLSH